jgi:uncharacterized membrane protein
MQFLYVLTLLCALGSGLIGGVFFAFSNFVMKALERLPPAQGIAAMQAINIVVLNRVFLSVFTGTALACTALAALSLWRWHERGAGWRVLGAVLYVVGTFAVTMAFNVPRNDMMAKLDPHAPGAAGAWSEYVSGWTTWNTVRAAAGAAALVALTIGLP